MGNKARPVTINCRKDPQGKIIFDMFEKGKKTDTLVFNKNNDKMPKSDSYDLTFTLANHDGLKLEFLQDTQHVMWVAKGTKSSPPGCPQSHVTDPEFTVTNVTATTLDVTNTDLDECKYKFVLNFIDTAHNNKAEQYDPIYDNQNGGFSRMGMANAMIIGGVAAVGAVLVLLVALGRVGWLR